MKLVKGIVASITLGLAACGGGTDADSPAPGNGTNLPPLDYSLYIREGKITITASPDTGNNGDPTQVSNGESHSLKVWGFTENESNVGTAVPGVLLEAIENRAFTVTVKNNLPDPHNFVIRNFPAADISPAVAKPISGSQSSQFKISPRSAGVYLYEDTLNEGVNCAVGLFGALVVRPESKYGNVAWVGGPGFDKEVLWVITDMDYPNWNEVALDPNRGPDKVDTAVYKGNYFLMNGMNGFQAMEDQHTNLHGKVGTIFLVRIVNAGQYSQSLHFHGNHFKVISRNGKRLGSVEEIDTLNVKPKETAMLLYTINKPGHYPMHVHTAQLETGNGVYLNGTAAMIIGE